MAGLGEAYLKFVNIGRFLKMPEHSLNLRIGQMELDIPFTTSKSIWVSPYDIYEQANIGVVNPAFNQQFVNNSSAADSGKGIELSGGRHTGGYNYSIAFIDQNTSGTDQATNNGYVPTATGSNFDGVGVASDANFKDIYASFNYRFNLEKDKTSRNAIQAAGASGPRDHTYLNFGSLLSSMGARCSASQGPRWTAPRPSLPRANPSTEWAATSLTTTSAACSSTACSCTATTTTCCPWT